MTYKQVHGFCKITRIATTTICPQKSIKSIPLLHIIHAHLQLRISFSLRVDINLRPPRIPRRTIGFQHGLEIRLPLLKERLDPFRLVLPTEHMVQNPRLKQMRLLRRLRPPPHQPTIQRRRHGTHRLGHLSRELQRTRQHAGRVGQRLSEQGAEVARVGREDAAGADEVHGAGETDEAREEVRGAGFHGDATAGEDEAVFGGFVGDSGGFVSFAIAWLVSDGYRRSDTG